MEPVKHGTDEMSSTSPQPLPHNEFRRTVSAAVDPCSRLSEKGRFIAHLMVHFAGFPRSSIK
jgi:hypothetical protein